MSTIDGKVAALDLHKKGKQIWSLEADSKPLYSSSLANMEVMYFRMISHVKLHISIKLLNSEVTYRV